MVEVNENNIHVFAYEMKENGDEVWSKRLLETFVATKRQNPLQLHSAYISGGTLHAEYSLAEEGCAWFQLNGGYFNDLGFKEKGLHRFACDVSGQACGVHTLRVKLETPNGIYMQSLEFEKGTVNMVHWSKDLGCAVVGKILRASYDSIILGTRNGDIHRIHTDDGAIQWTFKAGSAWSGGLLEDNRLYFGTASGDLYCVHPETGELRWKQNDLDPAGCAAAPASVQTGKGKFILFPSSSGNIYALIGSSVPLNGYLPQREP